MDCSFLRFYGMRGECVEKLFSVPIKCLSYGSFMESEEAVGKIGFYYTNLIMLNLNLTEKNLCHSGVASSNGVQGVSLNT